MKKFSIQYGIGKAKYLVNHYDGIKKNKDGSEFFDIKIFKNKKSLNVFVGELRSSGYQEK
jgi:hypothetical protein